MNTLTDSATLRLNGKHSTLFYARRGTAIVSTQGNILIITADHCMAEIVLAGRAFVIEGECHLLQRSGWVRLQASGAENAACLVLAPTESWLAAWWQRWQRRSLPLRSRGQRTTQHD